MDANMCLYNDCEHSLNFSCVKHPHNDKELCGSKILDGYFKRHSDGTRDL